MRDKKSQAKLREIVARLGVDMRPGTRFKIGDGWYRIRRGKVVRIPDKWVGRPEEMCGGGRKWREYKLAQRRKHPRKDRRRGWVRGWSGGRVERERQDRRPHPKDRKMTHPRNRSPRHLSRRERRDEYDGC